MSDRPKYAYGVPDEVNTDRAPQSDGKSVLETRIVENSNIQSQIVEVEPVSPETHNPQVYPVNKQQAEAIVVHCADPRFQSAFREFVNKELDITSYIPLVVGGGIHSFGVEKLMPKNFKIVWEQIKFFVKEAKVRKVIIINHEDCLWYKTMKGYYPTIELPVKGKLDLKTAAQRILKDFTGVEVRSFWAGLKDEEITFSETTND
jgi:hypothetical protein